MRRARRLRCRQCVLLGGLVVAATAFSSPEPDKAADAIFADYAAPGSPGVAVGVAIDGKPVLSRGYGYAHLEHDIPITPATVFHVASVSKQFTAFAAALLAADGEPGLDADVRDRLPEIAHFRQPVTVRQLAYHTSGLKDQWTLFVLGGMELDNRLRQQQILHLAARVPALNFPSGSDFAYSNTGYTMLSEWVARVAGQSFAKFTEAQIFAPLNMRDTLFYDDVTMIVPRRAQSYERDEQGQWKRSPLNFDNVGATSLHTTVEDLLRWGGNFFAPVEGHRAAMGMLRQPGALGDGTASRYGLGLQQGTIADEAALWHSGSDAGYRSIFAVFPERRAVITVLANSPADLLPVLTQLALIYLAEASADDAWRLEVPTAVRPQAGLPAALVGDYYSPGRPVLHLRQADEGFADAGVDDTVRQIVFREDGSFDFGDEGRLRGAHYRVQRDSKGNVAGLEERGGTPVAGQTTRFRRYAATAPAGRALAGLAGRYRNAALDITYEVRTDDGELSIRHIWSAEPVILQPTVEDHFEGNWPFHDVAVVRDVERRASALCVSSLRARSVCFERVRDEVTGP